MENGSGGFLSDLAFIGGNFGYAILSISHSSALSKHCSYVEPNESPSAYFGNQQFTTHHLVFSGCNTALQIHWDWAWEMQDIVIVNCNTGIIITGGVSRKIFPILNGILMKFIGRWAWKYWPGRWLLDFDRLSYCRNFTWDCDISLPREFDIPSSPKRRIPVSYHANRRCCALKGPSSRRPANNYRRFLGVRDAD